MTIMQGWDANDQALVAESPEKIRWLLAQAWDEGHRFTGYEPSPGENPYRTSPDARSGDTGA